MLASLRNRFGIPGVISVIALVFAMLGGAYAASSSNDNGKATASAKAKRGPRGPKGPAGPAGPAGPQGPAGAKGDTGAAGSNGKDGTNGTNGKDGTNGTNGTDGVDGEPGESPKGFPFPGNAEPEVEGNPHPCKEAGGIEYEVESTEEAEILCNGTIGKDGKEGSPWTVGNTLPAGAEEKGIWSFAVAAATTKLLVPISFPIPFSTGGASTTVHYSTDVDYATFCENKGGENVGVLAAAPSKTLCVRQLELSPPSEVITFEGIKKTVPTAGGMGPVGAQLQFKTTAAASGLGVWAVKG
jgi:hypothetical protein